MNDGSHTNPLAVLERDFSLTSDDVRRATNGELVSGPESLVFDKVGIDSRSVQPGHLFVAIEGVRHDGHTFIADVIQRGILGVVAKRAKIGPWRKVAFEGKKAAVIAVDDTTVALGDLAAFQRGRSDAQVVGITGSNGKTTTRRMTAAIFKRQFDTLATRGNYNNEIGLPLTLLGLKPHHQWIVLELGMNHFGEIRRLSEICRPDIGIITNIGPSHLEGVGSLSGVARAKAELLENIRSGGRVILNRDDPYLAELGNKTSQKVLYFGMSPSAHIQADAIREGADETCFTLRLPDSRVSVKLQAAGRFMVSNALAAAAAAYVAGLSTEEICLGLSSFRPDTGRMKVLSTPQGVIIIDDTYNANPASMGAAIDTLVQMAGSHRSILVVGDMLELGAAADRLHRQIGEKAGRAGVACLYVTGVHAGAVAEGARAGGMRSDRIVVGEKEILIEALKNELRPGDRMLVKGSRGAAMETIVEPIRQWVSG